MNNTTTKRQAFADLPVHPAAELLPEMSDDEVAVLAADIKANGMQQPILLFRDNREAANGSKGPFPLYLLDGRNRLAALKLLGIDDPNKAPRGEITDTPVQIVNALRATATFGSAGLSSESWKTSVDPVPFTLAMNLKRRHLTSEQKRQLIADYIVLYPKANDLTVGKVIGVSHTTVAEVRAEMSAENCQNGKKRHLPIERAKAALIADPSLVTLSERKGAEATEVSNRTFVKARRELIESGAIKAAVAVKDQPTTKPKQKATPTPAPAKPSKPKKQTTAQQDADRKTAQCAAHVQHIATLIAELDREVGALKKHTLSAELAAVVDSKADHLQRTTSNNMRSIKREDRS